MYIYNDIKVFLSGILDYFTTAMDFLRFNEHIVSNPGMITLTNPQFRPLPSSSPSTQPSHPHAHAQSQIQHNPMKNQLQNAYFGSQHTQMHFNPNYNPYFRPNIPDYSSIYTLQNNSTRYNSDRNFDHGVHKHFATSGTVNLILPISKCFSSSFYINNPTFTIGLHVQPSANNLPLSQNSSFSYTNPINTSQLIFLIFF